MSTCGKINSLKEDTRRIRSAKPRKFQCQIGFEKCDITPRKLSMFLYTQLEFKYLEFHEELRRIDDQKAISQFSIAFSNLI